MSVRADSLYTITNLDAADITNYWQYFELTRDPFAVGMDPTLYYAIPHWEEHLDLLQYLCHYNNVLLVVTGINGSGKTTLMRQFTTQVGDSMRICQVNAEPSFDIPRLLETIADGFELPWRPEDSLEEQLDAQLLLLQDSPRICVLLIDNAHLLPDETLDAFLYLIKQQSDNQMRLHIVLFGEPSLQNAFASLTDQSDQECLHGLMLEPLNLEETKHYLLHRLTAAGWEKEMPLSQEIMTRIYRLSGGVPGRINRIARRSMLDILTKQQSSSSESSTFLRQHMTKLLGAGLLIALLIIASLFLNSMKKSGNDAESIEQQPLIAFDDKASAPNSTPNHPTPNAATAPATSVTMETAASQPATSPATATMQTTTPTTKSTAATTADQNMRVITNSNTVELAIPSKPTASTTPAATITPPAPEIAAPAPVSPTAETAPIVSTSEMSTEDAMTQPEEPVAPIAKKIETSIKKAPKALIQSKKPATKTKAEATAKTANINSTEKRLSAADKQHYTLQVIGVSNLPALKRFMATHQLGSKASYYQTKFRNKDWYVLVYGEFATPAEARAAVKDLPKAVQNLKPWPRTIANVQESMRQKSG